jgi:hypothetical protein
MKKAEFLKHWQSLKPCQPIDPKPVPYEHEGSTFDQDGIRLTGSRRFIDSVLSHLKPLLSREDGETRLQVVYQQAKDKDTGAALDSWTCYVQVHERGEEAKMVNAYASALAKRPVVISRNY